MKLKQKTITVELKFDELFHMLFFHVRMLDMDMLDDLPNEIEAVFDKIRDAK